ncbi:hypothetical protein F1880_007225 [Penicillium rolfsii]|nr:hypothetical protein F1880_007225 [Penicillium rolfsii]
MAGETTTPQIKLRSACNQCHFSKVRCSGEKTGCSRCLNLGYTCVYVESRVGKVQGNRARRQDPAPSEASSSSIASQTTSTVELTASTSSPFHSSTAATSPPVIEPGFPGLALDEFIMSPEARGPEEALPHLSDPAKPDECSLQWDFEDLPSVGSQMDCLSTARIPCHPDAPADSTGFISMFHDSALVSHPPGSSVLYGSHGERPPKRGGHTRSPFEHARSTRVSSHGDPFHAHRRSSVQRMVSCVELVDGLEYYIHIRMMAVDEVLRMNKHCMTQVLGYLDWEKTNPNTSLLMLNCLVVHHVVTLFESASTQVLQPSCTMHESSPGNLSSTHFGNYCLDPEQRIDIQVRIFLKELDRCGQLVDRLTSQGLHIRDDHDHLSLFFPAWPEGLRARLSALREAVSTK